MKRPSPVHGTAALGVLLAIITGFTGRMDPAQATPVISDGAAERIERREAARAGRLHLPLPGTPDTETPLSRLQSIGVGLGARMMIRIFKAESELEVWFERDGAYMHFATYPVCFWSGTLGPKLREGDRQSPEGFYTITSEQLHSGDRWRRSLDLGFPNVFDQVNGRTGSLILVHGGCDSVGCFAMTNPVNAELYELVAATLRTSMRHVPVHVFPFRMTSENVALHSNALWNDFWSDLKRGYESFERTRLPPHVSVCNRKYQIEDGSPGAAQDGGIDLCPADALALKAVGGTVPVSSQGTAPDPKASAGKGASVPYVCSIARVSCRRWVALREQKLVGNFPAKRNAARQQQASKDR